MKLTPEKIVELAKPYSMLPRGGLMDLYQLVHGLEAPGTVVECGVANGGAAAVIWAAAGTGRELWLFDSFEGLPRPTEPDGGRAFSKYEYRMKTFGEWCKGDQAKVWETLLLVGKDNIEKVKIVPGWIEETLPIVNRATKSIAVLHIDVDFYEPTKCALTWLAPLVAPGGLIIVDDYEAWTGCRKAIDEWVSENGITFTHMPGSPVYWRIDG